MSDLPAPAAPEQLEYVAALEARVAQLENELQQLKMQCAQLPNTHLFSKDFLVRAMTIWGHNFVASVVILSPCICWSFLMQMVGNLC